MRITDKINFRQPKYMLPAIVYVPLLATGYFVFDMFGTEVTETQDKNLQTTEFLNPNLPGAKIKDGDGIGGKYENMAKSYGRIADYSAVDNIERDNEEEKEKYESKYTEEDLASLVPGMRQCTISVSETGKAFLHADNGSVKIERELTSAEASRLSLILCNGNLSEDSKRMKIAGMVTGIVATQQASQNFEQGMESETLQQNLQRK